MKKIISLLYFILFGYHQCYAIPPPDFIIQVVSNLWLYFAMWVAFFWTLLWTSFIYLKTFFIKNKKFIFIFSLLILIAGIFWYHKLLEEEKNKAQLKNLIIKKNNINQWLSYKDINTYNKYKNLSYKEKVKILLEIERVELEKWLFNKKNTQFSQSISNEELDSIIEDKNSDYILLDARETMEYNIWHIPWSIHHRIADLKLNSDWNKLNKNKIYIVICWWWMRGKLTSDFLQSKGIKTLYLEWGVKKWKEYWGIFEWETELADAFPESNFKTYVNNNDFRKYVWEWITIIDAREKNRLKKENILNNSRNISIMYSSNYTLKQQFSHYKAGEKVVVICDDYVNCFDAQMIWIELEQKGVTLMWIYFKRWWVE